MLMAGYNKSMIEKQIYRLVVKYSKNSASPAYNNVTDHKKISVIPYYHGISHFIKKSRQNSKELK